MSESTTYEPVMADSAAKAAGTSTTASSSRPGLRTRITDRFPFLRRKRGIAIVALAVLLMIGGGLAGLAALPNRSGSSFGGSASGNGPANNPNAIKSDTYFYGQSPAVEPSPNITGLGSWARSLSRAQAMVSNMTLDEKISLTAGSTSDTGCVGYLNPIERLQFPGMCFQDAGQGVRATDFVSAWPAGIHMGARYATPSSGRQERFSRHGNLPVQSVVYKPSILRPYGAFIYFSRPFQDAVRGGTANIMCSYQRVNNSYGCANSYTLNGLLKTELGFQGFVVSDWYAQYTGVATSLAGLDVTMPSGGVYWGPKLKEAVMNGSLAESRVDDQVTRLLASWYQLGQDQGFPTPGIGLPRNLAEPHTIVDARNSSFKSTLFDGAVEGHVLAKNTRSALPLERPKMLSVFGYSATQPNQYNVEPPGGTVWTFGAESADPYSVFQGFLGNLTYPYEQIAPNGTLFCGGGSGANSAALGHSPMDALQQQAANDDTAIFWDFRSATPVVNRASDACLVFGNAWASEGFDRPGLHDDYTDGLIKHVASTCNNTIVIFHNAGVRLVDQFVDNENVTALIFAHLPGQESGRALVSLLYGQSNSWGKLPYTVARNESDYGELLHPAEAEGDFELFPQANFTEGVYIDYRHFDANNIEPRYEFGYGLSYSTFEYANLRINQNPTSETSEYPIGLIEVGGQSDLWDKVVSVTADIRNTGAVNGTEIAQLYVQTPGTNRPRVLRGFEKPLLNPSQTSTLSFDLTRRDLSVWDTTAQKWLLQRGQYTVYVGSSSRKLPLNGTFNF
ncbi:beta-glucosidase 2 [Diaporthe helianthi]|uniref:beta-glucosidase n=1 Tax=Diaporthe helianthi TaxID=158607 RepID=A0A2P5HMY5_DIAHE|nr:beta-glucosidase 2 [Diaporthe helianthi]